MGKGGGTGKWEGGASEVYSPIKGGSERFYSGSGKRGGGGDKKV